MTSEPADLAEKAGRLARIPIAGWLRREPRAHVRNGIVPLRAGRLGDERGGGIETRRRISGKYGLSHDDSPKVVMVRPSFGVGSAGRRPPSQGLRWQAKPKQRFGQPQGNVQAAAAHFPSKVSKSNAALDANVPASVGRHAAGADRRRHRRDGSKLGSGAARIGTDEPAPMRRGAPTRPASPMVAARAI
jgi:hypothetical protein